MKRHKENQSDLLLTNKTISTVREDSRLKILTPQPPQDKTRNSAKPPHTMQANWVKNLLSPTAAIYHLLIFLTPNFQDSRGLLKVCKTYPELLTKDNMQAHTITSKPQLHNYFVFLWFPSFQALYNKTNKTHPHKDCLFYVINEAAIYAS